MAVLSNIVEESLHQKGKLINLPAADHAFANENLAPDRVQHIDSLSYNLRLLRESIRVALWERSRPGNEGNKRDALEITLCAQMQYKYAYGMGNKGCP